MTRCRGKEEERSSNIGSFYDSKQIGCIEKKKMDTKGSEKDSDLSKYIPIYPKMLDDCSLDDILEQYQDTICYIEENNH